MIDSVKLNFDQSNIWILNISLGLIMFGVALELTVDDFRRVFQNPKSSLIGLISQFVLLPAATFVLIYILKPSPSLALGMLLVASCPGGNISNFMTIMAKGNGALSVSLTAVGSVLAIVMTPLNLEFWGWQYLPTRGILKEVSLDPVDMVKSIILIAGIPILL